MAIGLGTKLNAVRAASMLLVVLFAGSAVAVCGPIGFVCLIVPHMARAMTNGSNLKVLVPFTALLGSILLLSADVLSRWIAFPFESPVGIVTALVGAPAFLYLARRQRGMRT
ncbi:putative siderophore transport system permease protein YfiZ precursor [compost metagenome]